KTGGDHLAATGFQFGFPPCINRTRDSVPACVVVACACLALDSIAALPARFDPSDARPFSSAARLFSISFDISPSRYSDVYITS
ncbi:hypothetical protein, partial [Pseudoflavonifractor phocaeensis]|uniref:hypothetical protein n=1 Tax=Pseudoflavonifractor phocaeensis TaxID=1870988 RepID=UPI00210B82EB